MHNDTCQLLDVNPDAFACAIYRSKLINVYIKMMVKSIH